MNDLRVTQRWYLLINGQVTEVSVDDYLAAAKAGQWSGMTRSDGTVPTWEEFQEMNYGGLWRPEEREAS